MDIPVCISFGIGSSGVRLVKNVRNPFISTLHTSTSSVALEKGRQHLYVAGMPDRYNDTAMGPVYMYFFITLGYLMQAEVCWCLYFQNTHACLANSWTHVPLMLYI